MKTAEDYTRATGRRPSKFDLHSMNCEQVGQPGHKDCGWCPEHDKPRYLCGHLSPWAGRGDVVADPVPTGAEFLKAADAVIEPLSEPEFEAFLKETEGEDER